MTSEPAGASAPKLKRVIRLDSVPVDRAVITLEGYLSDCPILTSVGIFEYINPDGSVRRELRLPEEVFDPESLASYEGKPIVITHDAGLITKDNVRQNQIGTILTKGFRSGDDVKAKIIIHDTDAMKRSRLKELSLGYDLDLEETPGTWMGQHYDAIQRNIRINHLALVREARAGDQARLNIDGRDHENRLQGGKNMSKPTNTKAQKKERRNDGILSPEELKEAIADYQAKRAAAASPKSDSDAPPTSPAAVSGDPAPAPEGDPKKNGDEGEDTPATIEEQVAALKEEHKDADPDVQKLFDIIDTLLAKLDFGADGCGDEPDAADEEDPVAADPGADPNSDSDDQSLPGEEAVNSDDDDDPIPSRSEEEVKMNMDSVDRIIRDRIRVGMVGRALNLDGLEQMKSLTAAKKAVIKAVRPTVNLDGKTQAYINAAFDIACDEVNRKGIKDTRFQKQQMFNGNSRMDAADADSAKNARERMIARGQNKKEEK